MRLALEEARLALGWSSPNPAVGAVVVRDGQVVGRGHTQPPGQSHAEVMALADAGDQAWGATVYVTLEPCSHQGRTPPCTRALTAAGVAEVVYAIADPDPNVRGDGHRQLEEAGIRVSSGDGAEESSLLLEGYLKQRQTGLPFVIAKFATSLDGRIASASGDSRWISGPEAREWAHTVRATLDAIVVGSGTVLKDDPQLTARPGGATEGIHQPLRVVLDSTGHIARKAEMLSSGAPSLVVTTAASPPAWQQELRDAGIEVLLLPARNGHVDLEALVQALGDRGCLTVLFEGGGKVLGSLFDSKLVDRVHAVVAPMVIGASYAPSPVMGQGAQRMANVLRLREVQVERLGADILVNGLV
ncbi:MAG: bifunctional diaminohydroxyphosphoribosylaminopyrimidine deaminase/5-amino-6-(5-phosphoribosylamino)uracil reductase RibD [Chloroflexi bacterium]|nr:MAG: bifunctional diaminohydroxyphosphoribosylaminopyrimidine deaminase/5-amino-6-(5-phosphoribosylamino)uracil reductase RibD [Chloroflexota bacterium]